MSAPPPRPGAAAPGSVERAAGAKRRRSDPPAHRRARWIAAAIIGVLAVGLAGWAIGAALNGDRAVVAVPPASPLPSATSAASPPGTDAAQQALDRLASLPVVSGRSDAPYDRDRFGQAWLDVDRNGCDTRNDILGRDLLDPVFKAGTRDCKVLSGTLVDPYDGMVVDFVSGPDTSVLVQIDHIVALAWAWRHGAEHWTDEERARFANDPRNLVAASEAMNQEKKASGPSGWLPPVRELRCEYVEQWTSVLDDYDLGVNRADRDAAEAVLDAC